jgi:3-deoxy-D-manno-octulosonic-acid transferase
VQAAFGDRVQQLYVPFALPGAVQRFLRRARPRLAVVMETELWPNLFHSLRQRGVPLLIANARLSPRSARSYQRLGRLTQSTIGCIDVIAAQSPADAERYASLGAAAHQLLMTGNIKFDMPVADDLQRRGQALRAELGAAQRPVWIAASTHEGEDELVLAAHRQLLAARPELLLLLVPRHPERFERVAVLCGAQGFRTARRSRGDVPGEAQVYLGDTMGELMQLYAAADVAFVGGSLVSVGGHNLLEPAALGLAPLSGPQLFNFQHIAELLAAADALTVVEDAAALAREVARLLADPGTRQLAGERARQVVEANRGALAHTLELIGAKLQ